MSALAPSTPVTEIPGRYSPVYIVDKRNLQVVQAPPVQAGLATNTTGGHLPDATAFYYVVTAVTAYGETVVSNEHTITTGTPGTGLNDIVVSWAALGASVLGYRIWRGTTSGMEVLLAYVTGHSTATYTDSGTYVNPPSAITPPAADSTGLSTSTTTNSILTFLPRCETADQTLTTPMNMIEEVGTNFTVGYIDMLPESKVTLNAYDVGPTVLSLLTGKQALAGLSVGSGQTTTWGFNDIQTANIDIVREFADPNGNIFASLYADNLVIMDYSSDLKKNAEAMEAYSLAGFNMYLFRGYIIAKAYLAASADASADYLDFSTVNGADEVPVALPVPTSTQPPSYWVQRGCVYFLKVARYRAATGWTQYVETASSPVTGVSCKWNSGSSHLAFAAGDIVAGDIFYVTFPSYGCDTTALKTIPQFTIDTSDAAAVPTRLTPLTISAHTVSRGQSLAIKMNLKRDRAEGIGDTTGFYGPPNAPEVTVDLDVAMTDMDLNTLMVTGQPYGTDQSGPLQGDFYDPNYAARVQLATATPVVAELLDPRNSGTVLKTITCPTAVFKEYNATGSTKNPVTVKYTGIDRVGNMTISATL